MASSMRLSRGVAVLLAGQQLRSRSASVAIACLVLSLSICACGDSVSATRSFPVGVWVYDEAATSARVAAAERSQLRSERADAATMSTFIRSADLAERVEVQADGTILVHRQKQGRQSRVLKGRLREIGVGEYRATWHEGAAEPPPEYAEAAAVGTLVRTSGHHLWLAVLARQDSPLGVLYGPAERSR